jgi:transcription-repair coupling factor (superfamily II helicase)
MTPPSIVGVRGLADLIPLIEQSEGFSEIVTTILADRPVSIAGAWGSARALTLDTLQHSVARPLLVVVPRLPELEELADDLGDWRDDAPLQFPAWQTLPREHTLSDPVFGARLRTLSQIYSSHPPQFVLSTISALLQPVPTKEDIKSSQRRIAVGDELDLDELIDWLIARKLERVTLVESPGEFRIHGGIVDIFPPDALDPVRIELFGDEVDSLRYFDAETQRTLENIDSITLSVVSPVTFTDEQTVGQDASLPAETGSIGHDRRQSPGGGESLLERLPEEFLVVLSEPAELQREGRDYLNRLDNPRGLYSTEAVLKSCLARPYVSLSVLGLDDGEYAASMQISTESVERLTGPKNQVLQELAGLLSQDESVLIACHNPGEQERLGELLEEVPGLTDRVRLCLGRVQRGFRLVDRKLLVIGDHELFGRADVHRQPKRRKVESRAIDSFLDLQEGDYVVHLTHGIGRFRGMKLLEKEEQTEEHLAIEFHDQIMIYVPVSLIHLVQKYVGAKKALPRLSRLGGTTWNKKKEKVAKAVADMASDMIRLQAARESRPGLACPPDSHWQKEFEASFPFTETDDQLLAIDDVKNDMERAQPMDRLICGDVGFGKTEVAIRAAFKAIEAGRQVAILVPTTVLAEQHFRTFSERMAEYPIEIEVLSRFVSRADQKDILERMERGAVDLVVGTHRLIQRDIKFQDLGLLIIDEEQRFGVEAKELLKQLRLEVDVLTLSATPIPRTLHMSLLGIRDISNLVTPPQERIAVKTQICRWDDQLIRNAIVRELNRGGQAYFVHNRVYNIQSIRDRLEILVPEARFAVVHGQMGETELEAGMYDFLSGRADVLVSTTIIESGLDIPNANTMFIHQAQNYGLADLHQLRGRVGRYRHRAYCYLMVDENKAPSPIATKRLKAIEEYSELGAGFKISMRDLEIRGAGNILGTEQSGHISAVGYELYCQLLENAVRKMKKQPLRQVLHVSIDLPVTGLLPDDYINSGRQKIEMYRKLSLVNGWEELDDVRGELRDRFGPLPAAAERLLELKALQLDARVWEIEDIHLEDDRFAVFTYRDKKKATQLAHLVGKDLRIVDDHQAYLLLKCSTENPQELLDRLKSVLQTNPSMS